MFVCLVAVYLQWLVECMKDDWFWPHSENFSSDNLNLSSDQLSAARVEACTRTTFSLGHRQHPSSWFVEICGDIAMSSLNSVLVTG